MKNEYEKFYLSDRFIFLKKNIDLLNTMILNLIKKINLIINNGNKNDSKVKEEIQINMFLLNYYNEIKGFYEQALFRFYAIINGDNNDKIAFFIEKWENEFDALKKDRKFNFQIVDIDNFVYKKVK